MNDSQATAILACLLGIKSNKAPEACLNHAASLLESAYQTVHPEEHYYSQLAAAEKVAEMMAAESMVGGNYCHEDENCPF